MNWIASKRLLVLEQGPQRWLRHWSICRMRRSCKSCHCSAWSRAGLVGGGLISVYESLVVWGNEETARLFSVLPTDWASGSSTEYNTFFTLDSGQRLDWVPRERTCLSWVQKFCCSPLSTILLTGYIDWLQLSQCLMGYSSVLIPYEAYLNSLPFSLSPV